MNWCYGDYLSSGALTSYTFNTNTASGLILYLAFNWYELYPSCGPISYSINFTKSDNSATTALVSWDSGKNLVINTVDYTNVGSYIVYITGSTLFYALTASFNLKLIDLCSPTYATVTQTTTLSNYQMSCYTPTGSNV